MPSVASVSIAGPVGLCLALHLSRKGVKSVLLETLPADRFLKQVLRAGTIHPARSRCSTSLACTSGWRRAA